MDPTGWSILFLYILNSSYNKNNICTKIIVADKCSVYRGISSKTINLKISKFLHNKKLNWKLVQFSPQNSTNYFEAISGKHWQKGLTLDSPHSNITIQFHIFISRPLVYGLVFASKQQIFADFTVFLKMWMFIITFLMKSALNDRKRCKLCF